MATVIHKTCFVRLQVPDRDKEPPQEPASHEKAQSTATQLNELEADEASFRCCRHSKCTLLAIVSGVIS